MRAGIIVCPARDGPYFLYYPDAIKLGDLDFCWFESILGHADLVWVILGFLLSQSPFTLSPCSMLLTSKTQKKNDLRR